MNDTTNKKEAATHKRAEPAKGTRRAPKKAEYVSYFSKKRGISLIAKKK